MKKFLKMSSTLSITCLLLLGNVNNIYAENFSKYTETNIINEISNKYYLEDIDIMQVPEGITPVEVDSSELENEILKFNKLIDDNIQSNLVMYNADTPTTYGAGTFTQKWSHVLGFCTSNLSVRVTQDSKKITKVSEPSLTLTGATIGVDITNITKESYIGNDGKNAYVTADYQVDYYLIVDGGIKLFSRDISQGFTYTYDKGITDCYIN